LIAELALAFDSAFLNNYPLFMSSVAEIEAALPNLTAEELIQVERAVHRQVLQRSNGTIYNDAYGVLTERDLIASADEAFQAYDKAESEDAKSRTR
jgi:hypothetical protein